jgi:putative ABC transport system permease protein
VPLTASKRALLAVALFICPSEFREHYRDELTEAFDGEQWLSVAADITMTGVAMRFEAIGYDFRAALGRLVRSPLITLVAIAAMAIGIGTNVLVAALVQGFFLRPLPFDAPGQLLFVQESNRGRSVSYRNAQLLERSIRNYADLTIAAQQRVTLLGQGRPTLLDGEMVSPNYFALLGVRPALGRFFAGGLADRSSAVVSYALWQQRGAAILGHLIRLGTSSYQVVGVAPPTFRDPTPYGYDVNRSYWVPVDPANPIDTGSGYTTIVRVHAGISASAVAKDLRLHLSEITKSDPRFSSVCCVGAYPVAEGISGQYWALLMMLYAFATIVALIAFMNVANLNFARTMARAGQLSLCVALGASPGRILSQLCAEAFLQAGAACALGLLLASAGLHYLSAVESPQIPQMSDLGMNGTLLVYACALVVAATVITGVLPGVGRSAHRLAETVKLVGRGHGGGRATRALSALVAAEIALATALLIGASLVLHSAVAMIRLPLGFKPAKIYVATVRLPTDGSVADSEIRLYVERMLGGLQSTVGASNLAASSEIPLDCCNSTDISVGPQRVPMATLVNAVSPSYFSTLGVQLLRGRAFSEHDDLTTPCAAVVDTTFARRFFATDNVQGRYVNLGGTDCTIIGLAPELPEGYGRAQEPMLYLAMAQHPHGPFLYFLVRTPIAAQAVTNAILRLANESDPGLPTPQVMRYSTWMEGLLAPSVFSTAVFGTLSLIAFFLALTGIYSLVSHAVAQQTRDFGIRSAVGATPVRILTSVLSTALVRSGIGIAIGLVLAALLAIPLQSLLYATSRAEPSVYASVIFLVLACTVLAAMVPAVRAARIEPAQALRHE